MAKYHINSKGEPGVCRALKSCPFASEQEHFGSKEEARDAYELLSSTAERVATAKRVMRRWGLPATLVEELQARKTLLEDSPFSNDQLREQVDALGALLDANAKIAGDLSIPHSFQEHLKAKYEEIDILLQETSGGYVVLQRIVIKDQRKGTGSEVMSELVRHADEHGWKLGLTPAVDLGASSKSRLEKFYRRFGFLPNRGRNKDFLTMEAMVRQPSKEA